MTAGQTGEAGQSEGGTTVTAATASPWHAMPVATVLDGLRVDPAYGLTGAEAAGRLARFGVNRLVEPPVVTFGRVLRDELTEPMILLLLAIAVLYSVWGGVGDTIAIVLVIATVVALEVFTEYRAKGAIAALSALAAPTAPVLRDGQLGAVRTEDLVPGDIVLLRAGERLAADLRLIESAGLQMDESALTGEPVGADKNAGASLAAGTPLAERSNLAYAGTTVTAGRGQGVVVATGMATELGRITGLVLAARPPRTPLQTAMRSLAGWLAWLALAFSVLIPAIGIVAGRPWREMVLTGLTLAFATVPEELPVIITMVLGLGAYRLSRRNALVKRLRAAETLGAVSVLATDKTGTLTHNRMVATWLWTGAWRPVDRFPTAAERRMLELAALCHDASIVWQDDGGPGDVRISGDPTDIAVLELAHRHGLLVRAGHRSSGIRIAEYGVDGGRKIMSVVHQRTGGSLVSVVKGAPEAVLARATRLWVDGRDCPIEAADRSRIRAQFDEMAARGLRVIAVGSHELPGITGRAEAEQDLVFAGLIGLADPPRAEAAEAVGALRGAGIRVVMVTGDHPATAVAVAGQVGLGTDGDDLVMTGAQLDDVDSELVAASQRVSVFARVAPEHKLRLVRALHESGEVVAVTGDGINDAPALAEADVGVAMGEGGTDVAREAADMVLADDNIATIAAAVAEGRQLFDNLRKGVRYYLACKVAMIGTVAAGVLCGLPAAFAPIQIVVLEAFMDVAGSATFVAEPAEADLLTRPPRDPRRRFLDRPVTTAIFSGAASLFVAVTGVYLGASWLGFGAAHAQTLAFTTWLVGYLVLAWVMRSERTPLARLGLLSNRFLPVWTLVTAAALALIMLVPPLRDILKLTTLSLTEWIVVVAVPVITMAWLEIAKLRGTRDSDG